MNIFFIASAGVFLALWLVELWRRKKLQTRADGLSKTLEMANQELAQMKTAHQIEYQKVVDRSVTLAAELRAQLDQEITKLRDESERIRAHYESEALKIHGAADAQIQNLCSKLSDLERFKNLSDAESEAVRILNDAAAHAENLRADADALLAAARRAAEDQTTEARAMARQMTEQAQAALHQAIRDVASMRVKAENNALAIAGDAYVSLRNKEALERAHDAIHNIIKGYGDKYVIPSHSALDDLAKEFGHLAAGHSLAAARDASRQLVVDGLAAVCGYVEPSRRDSAVRFVLDAFNGRVEAILGRVKNDDLGTLQQEINDAFDLVNLNGSAFRDARILPEYLASRLEELRWAVVVNEMRLKDREEQRRIREQIREEERARREYEIAIREAAKEEDIIRRAMENAQRQAAAATAEQRAAYEAELQELTLKLQAAEERNQRALSMAQQTKRGHVYIVSNLGSFGENIYKIGLTRRLEPLDRIKELSDASVPFDFDVHAMILADDAPALETQLHKRFIEMQVNKVNHRREFFKIDLAQIRNAIETLEHRVTWTMKAAAAEYHETRAIEKAIKENPELRAQWVNRQLQLDPIDHIPEEEPQPLLCP